MDGVPVKISEQCRPPGKVHLPASLRTLPPPEVNVQTYTFELEEKATHWVQERRRNLLSERAERQKRLELKDAAKQKQKEELEELAKQEQQEKLKREEEERQRQEAEAARMLAEEEERLRREEEEKLEEFRRRREQLSRQESETAAERVPAAEVQAGPESQPPEQGATASCGPEPEEPAAASPPTGTPSLPTAASVAPGWPAPSVVSSNPFNPFARPAGSAVLTPQSWQQPGAGAAPFRGSGFNYRDFESQASDPFDSAELKTINDMEELACVFRPSANAAAPGPSHSSAAYYQQAEQRQNQQQGPQPPQQQQQQQRQRQQQGAQQQRGFTPYPGQAYGRPAYGPVAKLPTDQTGYRYAGYAYSASGGGGGSYAARNPYPAATTAEPTAAYPAVSSASSGVVAPAQADAQQLHEFYTRYYASPGLRSSRSVPDLCEEVQREAAAVGDVKRTKSHTPPPQCAADRPAAAQGLVSRPEPAAEAADPLHGLEPAAKARLQELGQMGFPLDRLRRLHSQFNGDEKQVIEFALSAQRLEEAGHSALEAERGLLECDGDLGRAADFLNSLAQLTGLGFPEPRARDALRRADMHRDRALDLLIQG
ncbi:stress response protein NST1-like [Pollicipes pollicipes]|uniref:stress response protein NST1-like n=1 Tax=Pollicipes pollicipes TaxID=41117 RepID=UPI001884DD9D|nr:stress response protein NST1-like [Pollicipes pollicipes]